MCVCVCYIRYGSWKEMSNFNNFYRSQKSLDISSVVVNQMKSLYSHVEFVQGDVTAMEFKARNSINDYD